MTKRKSSRKVKAQADTKTRRPARVPIQNLSDGITIYAEHTSTPVDFSRVLEDQRATGERFDLWRDRVIDHLARRGLADVPVDALLFERLTDFGNAHTSPEGSAMYAWHSADATSIRAGEAVPLIHPAMTDSERLDARAIHADIALDLPVTARMLVEWVRKQGGDVQLRPDFVQQLARFKPEGQARPVLIAATSRLNPGMEAIIEVLRQLGETSTSDPRIIEPKVRRRLTRDAQQADPTFPKPIKIGPNTSVWIAAEVIAWCEQREREARGVTDARAA